MRNPVHHSIKYLCLMFFVAALLIKCSGTGGNFPQIASPPPFDYADGEELRTYMHQLAYELQRLDTMLMLESSGGFITQEEVVNNLENIERIGEFLRDGDMSTRHGFLRDDMSNFIFTVSRARMAADDNPPRFYAAGRVSGACLNCHRKNS